MCRIAYIPDPKGVEVEDLTDLFLYLEKTQGGDGNGLSWVEKGKIHSAKGPGLDAWYLALVASGLEGPVLFHTRRATTGPVCNELCQPFVLDNVAFVHNGMWASWMDTAMELLLAGDMDGRNPINDSLTAAVLAIRRGRYSLEAIRSGVFVLMSPSETWLHLRTGSFEYCSKMGIYASSFPTGWPASRDISNDAIARLTPNGPDFECGDWHKGYVVIGSKTHTWPTQQAKEEEKDGEGEPNTPKLEAEDDVEENDTEKLSDEELLLQLDHPSLRTFEWDELCAESARRQFGISDDEELLEHYRRKYGIQ